MEIINNQDILKWSPGDIKCQMNSPKATMFDRQPKKKVWKEIADELSNIRSKVITGEQCDGKWKGLKGMYKKIKDHNNTSGNSTKKREYFDLMDELLNKRPEIIPPATCSSDNPDISINYQSGSGCSSNYDFNDMIMIIEDTETTPPPSALKRKRKSIDDIKNKRHREKMEKQDQFLGLFQKLIDKI